MLLGNLSDRLLDCFLVWFAYSPLVLTEPFGKLRDTDLLIALHFTIASVKSLELFKEFR